MRGTTKRSAVSIEGILDRNAPIGAATIQNTSIIKLQAASAMCTDAGGAGAATATPGPDSGLLIAVGIMLLIYISSTSA
jgi:hypothetical protein